MAKGFVRDTAAPADIQTAAMQEQQAMAPSQVYPSGREFQYEWEPLGDAVEQLTNRMEVVEQAAGITPGSGLSYVHDQLAAAATWSITHNLGTKPTVTVVVGGAEQMAEIQYLSDTQVAVVFSQPTAGSAYLRG